MSNLTHQQYSPFTTLLWVLFLVFGIQIIFTLLFTIGLSVYGFSAPHIEQVTFSPAFMASIGVLSALCTLPFLKVAMGPSNKAFPLQFLAIKPINSRTLMKVLAVGVVCYGLESALYHIFALDMPAFMLQLKAQVNTGFDLFATILAVCIIAPIVEELIFRGLAYGRLVNTRLGVTGTIIVTSLVFTMIHIQYDIATLAILSIAALLFGYVRYKTQNLVYCIILHAFLNLISTIELFMFF
ncbi:CPBP family intramembrane glutamic endopeptidase [Thalassotalea aquiviva]|uniref:CPBP family intramembrane glutamic endopeptidase n=1 Tax=Thalassotalea aquiviva TaxID=3242415 RepID=UPI00352BAA03